MHGINNQLLDFRRQTSGAVIIDHGVFYLVTALGKDTLRRDITGHVVCVRRYPKSIAVQLLLEAERVVNHDLASQKDHGQVLAEHPRLHGIVEFGRQGFALVGP